jgi:cysteine desulfurase
MAIRCAVKAYNLHHIITSPIEHHCVEETVKEMEKEGSVKLHFVKVDEKGKFDLNHLEQLLKSVGERCLTTLMHGNNEIGTMMDINAVGELVKKYGHFVDTVQTLPFPF